MLAIHCHGASLLSVLDDAKPLKGRSNPVTIHRIAGEHATLGHLISLLGVSPDAWNIKTDVLFGPSQHRFTPSPLPHDQQHPNTNALKLFTPSCSILRNIFGYTDSPEDICKRVSIAGCSRHRMDSAFVCTKGAGTSWTCWAAYPGECPADATQTSVCSVY